MKLVKIIQDQNSYSEFLSLWETKDSIVYSILSNDYYHPMLNNKCLLIVRIIEDDVDYVIPFNHNESPVLDLNLDILSKNTSTLKYCIDKKSLLYFFNSDLNFIDLNINNFINGNDCLDIEKYTTSTHNYFNSKFYSNSKMNEMIPILKHYENFCDIFNSIDLNVVVDYKFNFWNNNLLNNLFNIEKSGLCVDVDIFNSFFNEKTNRVLNNNIAYSQYNFYTSTSRPSNRFGGINYSALKKDDKTRESFISRFGKDGGIFSIDYSSYHPRIIGELAEYNIPFNVDVYEYLGSYFFNKKDLTKEERLQSKNMCFKLLYGGIDELFNSIPYFNKINDYMDLIWQTSIDRGYAETPLSKRKILLKNIDDNNKNKLLNYIIQSHETELNSLISSKIFDYLKGKQTKYILYTYDSFTFDFFKGDRKQTILDLIDIVTSNNKFPVKCYFGDNYGKLNKIKI